MIKLFFLGLVSFTAGCLNNSTQKKDIEVTFIVDENIQHLDDRERIYFISRFDTSEGKISKGHLILPPIKEKEVYKIVFIFNEHVMDFNNIAGATLIPVQNIAWRFGIENKPFDKTLGLLSAEEYDKDTVTKQLTYLQLDPKEFGDGIQFVNKK